MSDTARDTAIDEDRLPWLEAVEDEGSSETVPVGKLVALITAVLVALGVVIGSIWAFGARDASPPADPKLIAAEAGDYKIRPTAPGGMKVEGKGDSAFATSEGAEATGKIDTNAVPEVPMKGTRGSPAGSAAGTPLQGTSMTVPKAGGRLVAKPPVVVAGAKPMTGGTMVQLGAYGSEAKANTAWMMLTKRYDYIAPLTRQIVAAEVGGSTVYRLRAEAGAQAASICSKLKAADENCLQVN